MDETARTDPAAGQRRQRPYLASPVFGAVLVGALVLGGWLLLADRATGSVRVTWAGQPTCTGTTVDDRGRILARPGMRCVVQVVVTNHGRRGVTLDDAVAQLSGPRTGAPLQALTIAGHEVRGEFYGRATVAEKIPGHAARRIPIVLAMAPNRTPCSNSTGTHYIYGWPAVRVTGWGRHRTVESDRDLTVRIGRAYVASCSA